MWCLTCASTDYKSSHKMPIKPLYSCMDFNKAPLSEIETHLLCSALWAQKCSLGIKRK